VISVTRRSLNDGTILIKIGRSQTHLKTSGEAEAFMAGVKIAHAALANKIGPLLAIKDGK
jgi:hypothetical protein